MKETAKHFEIKPKQVYEWHNKKKELLNVAPCTTVAQHLLVALAEKQSKFFSLILFKCNQYNYSVRYIAKTVSIRTTRHEKACFTVILRCLADGTKLLPTKYNLLGNPQSLLVLDAFRGHLVDSVKHWFNEKNTDLVVISRRITIEMNGSEDDLVFDYELLDEENASNENTKEVLTFDNINRDKYEEVEVNNGTSHRRKI
ncbi:7889_t:CDS:2 [Scutellospora calospora]|uniref:7889_t:CDS:1 n=1 Tax=Scutellospora calospora TaxID=85575 RepID=A0ACA9JUB1_9GLOM|nr:7889_t:CDS:2 [Scutellospora calospora]